MERYETGETPRYERDLDAFFAGSVYGPDNETARDYERMKLELSGLRQLVENLALCPDHRGKATGSCFACQVERNARLEIAPLINGRRIALQALVDLTDRIGLMRRSASKLTDAECAINDSIDIVERAIAAAVNAEASL